MTRRILNRSLWFELLEKLLNIHGFEFIKLSSNDLWFIKRKKCRKNGIKWFWSLAIKESDNYINSELWYNFVDDNDVEYIAHRFLINQSLDDDSLVLLKPLYSEYMDFNEKDNVILLNRRPRCLEELKIKLDLMDDRDVEQ